MAKQDGDPTNEERAASALAALESQEKYHDAWPEGLADSIVDLVTDLMHLAHLNDIEPDYIAQQSAEHYTAEVEEEAGSGSGPCFICQAETTYSGEYKGLKAVWLCPDHGGTPSP